MKSQFNRRLPQYRCHKIVGALHILEVRVAAGPEGGAQLIFTEDGFDPIKVDQAFIDKHAPHVVDGAVLVQYDDDYLSISPYGAFQKGYTRL